MTTSGRYLVEVEFLWVECTRCECGGPVTGWHDPERSITDFCWVCPQCQHEHSEEIS